MGGTDSAQYPLNRYFPEQNDGKMTHLMKSQEQKGCATPSKQARVRRSADRQSSMAPSDTAFAVTPAPEQDKWWFVAIAVAAIAVFTTLVSPGVANASTQGPYHSHSDILAIVEGAALSAAMEAGLDGVEVRVRPLDQRLRPAQCTQPLEISRTHAGRVLGPVSYGVRCSGDTPWTLYLRAEVSASMEIPVLRSPLPRGAIISEKDLEVVLRRISTQAVDVIIDPSVAVGMELKRPLAAGSPLRHGQVTLPQLIARGQTVTLVAGTDGLEVRMQGKAMGNGAEGDRLLVTNLSSGRRIEGVVLSDGSVRIP